MTAQLSRAHPIIMCKNVSLAYGAEEVVHNATLEVPPGVFMPFIGPNGAGKTTLLRAILGLIQPRCGHIRTPFRNRPPGYVPQQKMLDPLYPVSVRQIIAMGAYRDLGWWRRPGKSVQARIEEALERFGLAAHHRKTFAELSGGMRQKTLIARAFVSRAEVYVMDEPTSELDEDAENETLGHLHRLCREQGATVLIAHHGLDKIAAFSDCLCLMERGRVQVVSGRQATVAAGAEG
jgi:manganese/zinc/iron transport system ATP- binding protein